ncbi:hypothetical protein [Phycisphaera mikurensis]|uniref:Uncharacterized protein n=1 Tax=Phycisphaera mikurensis (strain NBRC 102666 / KCTC 22515 / FYK2301M01) TaxID=1142394 RepID=I0IDN6_PHYMF|nr:hypothetical protein [Phycisphaera mikurensis]MBB6441192.1 hypothetical protein [Phycisphaera mikurensis]BAM03374.1 hypothetical protein PSMK_12150 [Phycisphaera mikurensis NBRC 102666]
MRPLLAALAAPLLLAGCASDRAEVAALRAENAALRERLEASATPPPAPSPELREDLATENRRLEALAGLPAKGELVDREQGRFRSVFDPASGRTTVLSARIAAASGALLGFSRYAVAVGFTHPGEALAAEDRPVDPLVLVLETLGSRSSRLAGAETAGLVVDGEAFVLPLEGYTLLSDRSLSDPRIRTQNAARPPKLDERLVFLLPREAARALGRSRGGELRLPGLTLGLTREHAALARAAALRSE